MNEINNDFYKGLIRLSIDEYENLVETSNAHNTAVYDYLEKHGSDEHISVLLKGTYEWIKMIAEKNSIELEDNFR